MKIFDNMQNLWEHCSYCPVCKNSNRKITISTGPKECLKYISYNKNKNLLHLKSKLILKQEKYFIHYSIDCNDNSFNIKCAVPEIINSTVNYNVTKPTYYFCMHAECEQCLSYVDSINLELDPFSKKIYYVGIEREGLYLLDSDDNYLVTLDYNLKSTLISKCHKEGHVIHVAPALNYRLLDLDFKDSERSLKKIKMIVAFS